MCSIYEAPLGHASYGLCPESERCTARVPIFENRACWRSRCSPALGRSVLDSHDPADPPTVEEIIAVMRQVGSGRDGARLRALIVILWRAGLRIGEALDLAETDLDASRGAVLVRRGKGGRRREVGMDRWAWSQLDAWLALRRELPVGALLCVVRGATAGGTGTCHRPASSWRVPRPRQACAGGSRPISCVTRTRSRWRTRACRWW